MNEERSITADQAFGILAAEHAQLIVQNRLLQAENVQLRAKLSELTPKEPTA